MAKLESIVESYDSPKLRGFAPDDRVRNLLIFKHCAVQEPRTVNDPEQVDCLSRNPKHTSIIAVERVAVTGSQNLVFWDQWASFRKSFQGLDLFFDSLDEPARICGTVMCDKIPDFFDVPFGGSRKETD